MLLTNMRITQVFLLPDPHLQSARFNRVRWYRSTTGPAGYFEAVTSLVAQPALLSGTPVTRALAGTELRLRINGTVDINLPFVGPGPVELVDIVALLNGFAGLLVATVQGSSFTLETATTGSSSSLQVLDCTAAPLLGLVVGESAAGTEPDNALSPTLAEYRLVDSQSSPAFYYRVELVHTTTAESSGLSAPFRGRSPEALPLDTMIGCFVRLVDLQGRPLAGRRVFIHNVFLPNKVEDPATERSWGIFRQFEEMSTDPNGYASIFLLRGALIDVTISGTGFTRRLRLPSDLGVTLVDLLDASLVADDEFGIQQPKIPYAIRTS